MIKKGFFDNNKKRNAFLFGLSFFLTGILTSIVATAAWYNIVDIARINNINLIFYNEDTTLTLELLDRNGEVVKNEDGSIKYGEFTNEELGINSETKLDNVSGMFESSWNGGEENTSDVVPTFRSAYRSVGNYQQTVDATGGYSEDGYQKNYIQNSFYLTCSKDARIYLSDNTNLIPNEELNEEIAKRTGASLEGLNKAAQAARISFYSDDGYVITKLDEEQTLFGGILDINCDGYYDYRSDDEEMKEVLYGEYDSSEVIYEGVGEAQTPLDTNNTFISNHKEGVKMIKDNGIDIVKKENSVTIDSLKPSVFEELGRGDGNEPEPIMYLKANERKRLVVSIYIEGWDLNTTDEIQLACFNFGLGFVALTN